jgi:hypothetical protein
VPEAAGHQVRLVPDRQDLDIFGGVGSGEQRQPAQHAGKCLVCESKPRWAIMLSGLQTGEGEVSRRVTVLIRPSWPWRAAHGRMKLGAPPADAGRPHCCREREDRACKHNGVTPIKEADTCDVMLEPVVDLDALVVDEPAATEAVGRSRRGR